MSLLKRKPRKRDLTVAEYLCHMGEAVVRANIEAMRAVSQVLATDGLDVKIPISEHDVGVDGATLVPEGWIGLDEMEIECESGVRVSRDENGEPVGLAMTLNKGLLRHGMHVRFRAKFCRRGRVEGIEILRDAANESLRRALASQGLATKVTKRG